MLDRDTIERAREIKLPAYLEYEGILPQKGSNATSKFYYSPFREERTPSLHISYQNGVWVWYDHGLVEQRGGDAITFVMKLKDYSFVEAVEELA